jgi:hypothetical protein
MDLGPADFGKGAGTYAVSEVRNSQNRQFRHARGTDEGVRPYICYGILRIARHSFEFET